MGKVFWVVNGLVCAGFLAFVVAPNSEHSGFLYVIAAMVLFGGIAKASGVRPPL